MNENDEKQRKQTSDKNVKMRVQYIQLFHAGIENQVILEDLTPESSARGV